MKKNVLFLIAIVFAVSTFAQAPQAFKFQTVVRDGNGEVLPLQDITLKFQIRNDSPEGDVAYAEQHFVTTNAGGLVSLNIGGGEPINGTFGSISWGDGSYFLEELIDVGNTGDFEVFGTVQLLSVPYALHANTAGNGIQSMSTEERDALENPAVGMQIYNTTTNCLNYWSGSNWFETCGDCTPQPDNANAGPDQEFFDSTTVAQLEANIPEFGQGEWTKTGSFEGYFDDPTDPSTLFHGEPCKDYFLQWTISTSCGSNADNVKVTFDNTPSQAFAGEDILINTEMTTITLDATIPENGDGLWTVISGEGGSFADETNPNTEFIAQACETYQLVWAISTACDVSSDTVKVDFFSLPTEADAGEDQFGLSGTWTTLEANNPQIGEGQWTILSGEGGQITNPSSPTSLFLGQSMILYELEWQIATACDTTRDEVNVAFGFNPLNVPPNTPSNPNPANNAAGLALDSSLSWSCSDPENDPITYDVYFGTQNTPPQVAAGIADTFYIPGTLEYAATYYWKIVAHDDQGNSTEGEVWSFASNAQLLELYYNGELFEMGENVTIIDYPQAFELVASMSVKNTSSETLTLLCRKIELEVVPGTSNVFCWGICYAPSVYLSPLSVVLGPGETTNEFSGHYMPGGIEGMNKMIYSFFPQSSPNDSTYFYVDFHSTEGGVGNQPPETPSPPNPENGAVNQPIIGDFSWSCSDPENDPLTYDVYFGTEATPPQVANGIVNSFYTPGTLEYATSYYWKIVAHDDHGNSTEGEVWSFTTQDEPLECGDTLIDPRDGQKYTTAQIGDQCWMAENLNIGERIDGSEEMTDNGTIEKYCYDNDSANCETYGGLYEWNEMMQYSTTTGVQDICPPGWHLPTDDEWKILEGAVDSQYPVGDPEWDHNLNRGFDAGLNLKSTSGWNSNGNGTNLYGFSALPGGYRDTGGSFFNLGLNGYWWSSDVYFINYAWHRTLYWHWDISGRSSGSKEYGFSVRCLRD